jgi:hypothetical protein
VVADGGVNDRVFCGADVEMIYFMLPPAQRPIASVRANITPRIGEQVLIEGDTYRVTNIRWGIPEGYGWVYLEPATVAAAPEGARKV